MERTQKTMVMAVLLRPPSSTGVSSSCNPLFASASISAGCSWRSVENAHSRIASDCQNPKQTKVTTHAHSTSLETAPIGSLMVNNGEQQREGEHEALHNC